MDSLPPHPPGTLPRRQALKLLGMGGLAIGLGPSLLAACGVPTPAGGAGTGAVRGVLQSSFDPMDPHVSSNAVTVNIAWYVYEGLYAGGVADPTAFSPELAAGAPAKVDDTTYTIKLRQGATFHDGSPVTPDDVVFSFQRVVDPTLKSFLAKYLTNIAGVTASGPDAVTVTLKNPMALLEQRLAVVKILSKAAVTGPNGKAALEYQPVGTGPYKVVSASPTASAQLTKNTAYNGPITDLPGGDIGFEIVTDPNARIAALQSNGADVINNVQLASVATLSGDSRVTVGRPAGYSMHIFLLNAGKPPFNDRRVRQALMYGLDRDAIVAAAYYGLAVPADSLMPTTSSEFSAPSTIYRRDVAKAKQLLAEAGFGGGLTFELQVGVEKDGLVASAQLMQQQLKECGVDVTIRQGQIQALYTRVSDGSYQAFYAPTSPALLGSADAEFTYRWLYYGSIPETFLYWSEPEKAQVEGLLDQAIVAKDGAEYRAVMAQVQDICASAGALFPVVHINEVSAWNPAAVSTVTPYPLGGLILANGV